MFVFWQRTKKSGASVWSCPLNAHFYTMRGCSSGSVMTLGYLCFDLHQQLANISPAGTDGGTASILGVVWDSTTMQARLSPAHIESTLLPWIK